MYYLHLLLSKDESLETIFSLISIFSSCESKLFSKKTFCKTKTSVKSTKNEDEKTPKEVFDSRIKELKEKEALKPKRQYKRKPNTKGSSGVEKETPKKKTATTRKSNSNTTKNSTTKKTNNTAKKTTTTRKTRNTNTQKKED